MKKILLYGDYDMFYVGGIKFFKEKNDSLLLTVKISTGSNQQKQTMIDGVRYLKSGKTVQNLLSKEKLDFLAIISGDVMVDTIQEFNKTKFLCDENNTELAVISTYIMDGLISVNTANIYEKICKPLKKEL